MFSNKMALKQLNVFLIIIGLNNHLQVYGQVKYQSPCPRLFQYEEKNTEPDKWYGIVTLLSDNDLAGVWLRLVFDKPVIQVGNWYGQVEPRDMNVEYLIKNRNAGLKANVPQAVRFFVKYDPNEPAPKFVGFRLNAVTMCPEGLQDPTTPSSLQLFVSNRNETVVKPVMPPSIVANNNPVTQSENTNVVTESNNNNNEGFFKPGGGLNLGPSPFGDSNDVNLGQNEDLNEVCGTVIRSRPLITHGLPTFEGEFPWHVAIYHTKSIHLAYWCGGSLITGRHLITAAHAVTKWKTNTPRNVENFVVYLGKYYLNRFSRGIQERLVDEIFPHPEFNPQRFMNDIAIIKLDSPVQFTEYVRPICLWHGSSDLNGIVNSLGSVVGWGADETGRLTETLMQAKMPVASFEKCVYSLPLFYSHFISNTTYCAGFKNGTTVCNGDSGGGMVFPIYNANKNIVKWHLRGLVSLSADKTKEFKCSLTHYVIFTDIAKYMDWIQRVIQ